MLLFSLSIVSDRWSLKIENKNNSTKTLTAEAPYRTRVPGWLELPLTGTNFHGPTPVRAIEILL